MVVSYVTAWLHHCFAPEYTGVCMYGNLAQALMYVAVGKIVGAQANCVTIRNARRMERFLASQ